MTAVTQPVNLRCEYDIHPLAVDTPCPRMSWQMASRSSDTRDQRQTAYQILVAATEKQLAEDTGDLWDSGRVDSDGSIHIPYAGQTLASRQRCYWKVRTWDKDASVSPWSESASWSMGILDPRDWQGRWIAAETEHHTPDRPAVLMRREFILEAIPSRAIAYLCGLGYHELFINGHKVGNHKLDPAFTDYSKRVLYVAHDVTAHLTAGRNVLGVILGGGWYDLATPDGFGFHQAPWTTPPRLLLDLNLEFPDGTRQTIATDPDWKWSTGAIIFNCVRGGETIDARAERPGWNSAHYDDSKWSSAVVVPAPAGQLESQKLPPIRATTEIPAVRLTEPRPGVFVFDLGVNIAGWARFQTSGQRDQEIVLSFNEQLNDDGTVNTKHLISHIKDNGRFQTGRFILKGEGVEVYEPRFTYHGFQYVQIEGLSHPPVLDDLTGVWVHTDPSPVGWFTCSDERINQIQQVSLRSFLNNLHSIPTDCPHREKMGWMLDGFMTMEMACFNFDMAAFYAKWLGDMIDAQGSDGQIPSIVPTNGWGRSNPDGSPPDYSDPWWGGSLILIAWKLYHFYSDDKILEDTYESMKKYVDYLHRTSKDLILHWGLGDWLEPDAADPFPVRTPVALTSTAAFYHFSNIVSQAAQRLNRSDEAQRYASLAGDIRVRFNETFFNADTGLYAPDSQTAQILALALKIAPEDRRPLVFQRLAENITRREHLSTGFVGTPFILNVLTEFHRADLAYKVVTQDTGPSWWDLVQHGDTAFWESWRGEKSQSFNHPGFGCVGDWFYKALVGIRPDPSAPGFKHFFIRPDLVGDLTFAKGHYRSIHGQITSEWHRTGDKFAMVLTIPANTTATVFIPAVDVQQVQENGRPVMNIPEIKFLRMEPGRAVFEVSSGHYQFSAILP